MPQNKSKNYCFARIFSVINTIRVKTMGFTFLAHPDPV